MGQNFLIDGSVSERMVREARIDGSFGVLEVGPGAGALTLKLCAAAGKVAAVELDKRLIPELSRALTGFGNVEIVQGDILKLDIERLASDSLGGLRRAVCANLPYNITTPAITALLRSEAFESITVMTQREVAERICAPPGGRECGALSVFCQFYADCEILFSVPPGAFFPRPKVHSAVVAMRVRAARDAPRGGEAMFFRVVRAAFAQRRKTLVNALYAEFGREIGKDGLSGALTALGYDARIRGEALGVSGFAELAAALTERLGNTRQKTQN
jgi:16S rRNA (adenine1518-N6/adenine1519-N6)-dimethyltransferase